MELTIKHLAAYLPYGLKYQSQHVEGSRIYTMEGINVNYNKIYSNNDYGWSYIKGIKPLLFSLSDLTKEITINGETFVPSRYWDDENRIDMISHCSIDYEYCEYLECFILEKLLEWKFDIFNLIPQGLAININEINNL
jgi:hypothetical protein